LIFARVFAGLKRITLHQLRHTNVSIMISMGLDIKTIQSRGGYSNATTPLNIYGHLFNRDDKSVADGIADIAQKK
jgi:site-specific recombinase XerD